MRCAACNQTNREGARFCDACGAALAPSCATCGTELREGARFCDACGAATEAATSVAEPARKTVTVLFADLVGSTAFAEAVDAEVARSTLGRYHDLAQQVVTQHGGTIAKFIGDGVMVTFGIPEVAEDDAVRAIRTGAALQDGFAAIGARVLADHGLSLALRVGINTGEVVVASDDADLVGDAINTAARIEAACPPGSVLVGEQTWRLTRGEFDYQSLEAVAVRGKADPVATFQLLQVSEADNTIAFFVGRTSELETIERVFADRLSNDESAVVTVIGSPGVGKTRLASEFRATLGGRANAYDLRIDRSTAATFAPIAELYTEFGAGLDLRREVVATLDSFTGDAPPRSTEESFWATRQLLEGLASDLPAVLVIDDIQWAEPLFLELLEYLAEWLQAPVMIIGLARPELRDVSPALSQRGRSVHEVIELDGLPPAATEQLAAQMLGADVLPAELLTRLGDATQGNPLFVCELIRMLVDDETLVEGEDGWQLTIDGADVDVPPTIQSLLATRIERLPDDERRFIEAASVIGAQFERGAAVALLPDMTRSAVDDVIERLRKREIIDSTGTYWADQPVLRFHHVLIRDSAYRRILKESRADLHLEVATWIDRVAKHTDGHHEITIANHLSLAHTYRTELGRSDDETDQIGEHCAVLLDTAADRALDQDDLRAAGDLAIRAFRCVSDESPARSELLLTACEALLSAGAVREAEPLIEEFEQLAQNDDRLLSWTVAFKGHHAMLGSVANLSDWEHLVAGAAKLLDELGDVNGVAKARLVRAIILARLGQVGACEEELDRALTAARVADDRRRITSVLGAAPVAALWGPSPVARAGGRCLDVIRLLRITSASPMVEAISIRCQAVLEAMRGRNERARELIATSRETVEELGHRHGILETEMFAGIIELLAGDPVAAEPHLRAAMEGLGVLGVGADAGQAAAHLARALLQQGRLDEAEDLADDSDSLAGQNLQTAIASRAVRAELAAARGSSAEALTLASEAVEIAEETDLTWDHAQALLSLAAVLQAAGADATAVHAEANRLLAAKGAGEIGRGDSLLVRTASHASVDHHNENEAAQTARACQVAINNGDLDRYASLLADDFRGFDHRPLEFHRDLHKDHLVEAIRGLTGGVAGVAVHQREVEILASRSHHLALYESGFAAVDATADVPWISVIESREGRIPRNALFDVDQVDAAFDQLDEWYLESLAPAEAAVFDAANRFSGAISRGDVEALEHLLAEDFESHDHQQLGFPTQNAEQWMQVTTELGEQAAGQELRLVNVHHLSATTLIGTYERFSTTKDASMAAWRQTIAATFDNGRISRLDEYDEHDLERALEEAAGASQPSHLSNRATELFLSGAETVLDVSDLPAYADRLALDHRTIDHRGGAQNQLGRDDMLETARLVVSGELGQALRPLAPKILAIRGEHLLLAHTTWVGVDETDDVQIEYLRVNHYNDAGLLGRSAIFEPDQIDQATEQLDVWHAANVASAVEPDGVDDAALVNEAVRFHARMHEAVSERRFDELEASFADDFEYVDRRGGAQIELNKTQSIESLRMLATGELGSEVTPTERKVLLVLGDELVLSRSGYKSHDGAHEMSFLRVSQVHDGLNTRQIVFDVDDFRSAFHVIELWFEESLPPVDAAAFRTVTDAARASTTGDTDRLADLLAGDFSMIDHRKMSFGSLDRGGFLGGTDAMHETGARFHQTSSVLDIRGSVLLSRVHRASAGGSIDWDFFVVSFVRAGRVQSFESFDLDDREAAWARFEELTSTGNDGQQRHPGTDQGNTAVQATFETARLLAANDIGGFTALLAPDHVTTDYRSGVQIAMDAVDLTPTTPKILATRADNLSLARATSVSTGDEEGVYVDYLVVSQTNEHGLLSRAGYFDVDKIGDAVDLLEKWYLESLPETVAAVAAVLLEMGDSLLRGEAVTEYFSADCRIVDHRPTSFGDMTVDEMRAANQIWAESPSPVVSYPPAIHALSDKGAVFGVRREADGATWEYLSLAVVEHGRVTDLESFEANEVDRALARFAELTTEPAAKLTEAQQFSLEQDHLIASGQWEAWSEHLADDFVSHDNRALVQTVFDREQSVETIRLLVSDDLGRTFVSSFETVETRGEYLHLGRMNIVDREDADVEVGMLIVDEWAPDGTRLRSATFDPPDIDAAIDLLELWARSRPSDL